MSSKLDSIGASASVADSGTTPHNGGMRFLVAQVGARMHYAIPRILEAEGVLARFCTDICAAKGWPWLLRAIPAVCRPAGLRRLMGRLPTGVPAKKIRAFTAFGWEYSRRTAASRTPVDLTNAQLFGAKRFCELILREGLEGITDIYTFNAAGLELLRSARSQGIRGIVEQTIAPARILETLLVDEQDQFSNWEMPYPGNASSEEFYAREQAEWRDAQLILCGSDFVKNSIAACGGPVERCRVVPYGVDPQFGLGPRLRRSGPLRVLTVGTINLRKGAPYVLNAARRLQGRATFRMVGQIGVSHSAEAELRRVVELRGPIPRSEMAQQYAWADVFFLPSLCEGSATVTYEALACGLPVVCTPNTGSVVRDGIDGFVVAMRDAAAMADRLEKFDQDREFLAFASEKARQRATEFTLEAYRSRLMKVISRKGL